MTWLDSAYSDAIAGSDLGLLDRCNALSNVAAAILLAMGLGNSRYLDWAGGYGVFTRLMRDRGFEFVDHDPYADNVFAGEHRLSQLPTTPVFAAVTAFEVLEHLTDPVEQLREVSGLSDVLITTTQVLPEPAPRPGEWDYYALDTGQHVTFYTQRTIEELGRQLGFPFVASGPLVHLFSRRRLNRYTLMLARRHQVAYLVGLALSLQHRRRSLLAADLAKYQASLR